MPTKSDYYDVLGVGKNASEPEIKSAYRTQALKWHPDKHKDDKETAEKKFKEINEAYQVLSDQQKRHAYDQFGHSAFTQGQSGGSGGFGNQTGGWGPFTYTYTNTGDGNSPFSEFDFGNPFDIFDQFFSGANPFSQRRSLPRYVISIDFMEAIDGVEKEVKIDGKKRTIKIPQGIDDGSRIRFNDFILQVNVKPHSTFQREGADIIVSQKIPFSLLALGGNIKVPTVTGDVTLRLRRGTQPGTIVRLRGKGAPIVRGRGRGDQYVKLQVDIPDKLDRDQKNLLDELSDVGL